MNVPKPVVELLFALLVGALCIVGYFEAAGYRGQSAYLPVAVMVLGVLLSTIWAVKSGFLLWKAPEAAASEAEVSWSKLVAFVFSVLVYALSVPVIGFFTMTLVFVPVVAFILGYRKTWVLLATPALFVGVLYVLFRQVLQVPLPNERLLLLIGVA